MWNRLPNDKCKKALYRLNELVVQWVIANPEPVKLGDEEYNR